MPLDEHIPTDVSIPQRAPQGRPSKFMNRRYSEAEVKLGLEILAATGNAREASRRLAATGRLDVIPATLLSWKKRYPEQFEAIQHDIRDQIDKAVVREARDIIREVAQVEMLAVEKTRIGLEDGSIKDPSTALRNLSTSKAINIDKVRLHEGNPTEIVEKRTIDQTFRALKQIGRMQVVDSTADEVPVIEPGE